MKTLKKNKRLSSLHGANPVSLLFPRDTVQRLIFTTLILIGYIFYLTIYPIRLQPVEDLPTFHSLCKSSCVTLHVFQRYSWRYSLMIPELSSSFLVCFFGFWPELFFKSFRYSKLDVNSWKSTPPTTKCQTEEFASTVFLCLTYCICIKSICETCTIIEYSLSGQPPQQSIENKNFLLSGDTETPILTK